MVNFSTKGKICFNCCQSSKNSCDLRDWKSISKLQYPLLSSLLRWYTLYQIR